MKIQLTTMYVDDQEKALRFYTEKLGFQKKSDFSNGDYRWLTVVAADQPDGVELVLEKNAMPAAATYQKAMFDAGRCVMNFYVSDVNAEYERLKQLDVAFTKEPMKTHGSTIATLDDGCGNLIQLTKLDWS